MSATDAVDSRSGGGTSVSETVVYAVADETGSDPARMPPLYDVIDPQALDRLFRGSSTRANAGGRVIFTYEDCEVTVFPDGEVTVEPTATEGRVGT